MGCAVLCDCLWKLAGQGHPTTLLEVISVVSSKSDAAAEEDGKSTKLAPCWSLASLFGKSDKVDKIILRMQTTAAFTWLDGIKTMETVDQLLMPGLQEILYGHDNVLRLRSRPVIL